MGKGRSCSLAFIFREGHHPWRLLPACCRSELNSVVTPNWKIARAREVGGGLGQNTSPVWGACPEVPQGPRIVSFGLGWHRVCVSQAATIKGSDLDVSLLSQTFIRTVWYGGKSLPKQRYIYIYIYASGDRGPGLEQKHQG